MTSGPEQAPQSPSGTAPEQTPPSALADPVRETVLGRIAQAPVPPTTGARRVTPAEVAAIMARRQAAASPAPTAPELPKPAAPAQPGRQQPAAAGQQPINVVVHAHSGAGSEAKPPEAAPPASTKSHHGRNIGIGLGVASLTATLGIVFLPSIEKGVSALKKSDKATTKTTPAAVQSPAGTAALPGGGPITSSSAPGSATPTAYSPNLLQITDIPSTKLFTAKLAADAQNGLKLPITETMTLKIGKVPMKYTIKGYGAVLTMAPGGDISLDVAAPASSGALALSPDSASIGSDKVVQSPSKTVGRLHLDGLQVGIARLASTASIDNSGVSYTDAKGVNHVQPISDRMRASIETQIIGSQAAKTTGQVPALTVAAKVAFVKVVEGAYGSAIAAADTQLLTAYETAMVKAQSINPGLVTNNPDNSKLDLLKAAQLVDPKIVDTPSAVFKYDMAGATVSPTTLSLTGVPYKVVLPGQTSTTPATPGSPQASSGSSGK